MSPRASTTSRTFLLLAASAALFILLSYVQESEQASVSAEIHVKDKCNCVCGVKEKKQRIVGGRKTAEHEFPWIVMLSYGGTFFCGGTLLTKRHVLTAAHCVHGRRMEELKVTLGEHDRNRKDDGEEEVRSLKNINIHSNFSLAKIEHDIAIIELSRAVSIDGSNIRTACLPVEVGRNYSGLEGIVAGWGRVSEKGWTSGTLRKVSLPLLTREECAKMGYPPNRITNDVFCAAHPKGKKDACQGDSGGPMHLNGTTTHVTEVIGVVSWGRGCGRPNYPGVYMRTDRYMRWIKENIDGECLCGHPQHSHGNDRIPHPGVTQKPRRVYNSWG